MDDKLHFAVDLYQGTAEYYDRYPAIPGGDERGPDRAHRGLRAGAAA
jgi:hypothetical protein